MLIPTHIEVPIKAKIFNNARFCADGINAYHPECRNLERKITGACGSYCNAFLIENGLEVDDNTGLPIKCDQCKEAYQAELKRIEALEDSKPAKKTGEECEFDCEKCETICPTNEAGRADLKQECYL